MITNRDEPIQQEPDDLENPLPKKKRWWKITKAILGFILPFLIVGSLPLTIWLVDQSADNADSITTQEKRWQDLNENWIAFQDQRRESGEPPIKISQFDLALCPFGDSEESWNEDKTPEAAGFICGYVPVPLYHDQPLDKTIQVAIAVAIWPTYDEPHFPDPLFITQGGPGGSTLELFPKMIFPYRSGGERDLVFVEQRGTRYSYPDLSCSITDWEEALPEDEDPEDYEYKDFLSSCRKELMERGIDLNAFTTPQIAHDFEEVRQVLGYEKINFYGVSYGTLVGQYLAAQNPDSVKSLVLDGVVTLPLDYMNQSLFRIDRVISELASSCTEDPACAEAYPNLIDRFNNLLNEMETEPKDIQIVYPDELFPTGDTLDGETFYYFFLHMFYYDHSFAFLPYIMEQAENNNFDLFEVMTEWLLEFNLVQSGLFYSVICSEHEDFAEIKDGESHLIPAGIDWEGDSRQDFREECAIWDVQQAADKIDKMPTSDIPTLLMSGHFDPVTPPRNGDIVLNSFSNGQHLVDPVGGHGVVFSDDCTESILKDFLNGPNKNIDSECLEDEDRRTMAVPPNAVSSPFMYKILDSEVAFPLMVLMPIAMVILMIFRSAGNYFVYLWRAVRGKHTALDERAKRLRLRYELLSWTFAVASLGLAIGFSIYSYRAFEVPSFLYALAMPGGVRMILVIPWLLILIFPFALYYGVRMYIRFPSIPKRIRYIWQAAYCLAAAGFLIWSGILWA